MDWQKIIQAAHEDNEKHGVQVQRGKKYSQVATRIERFRLSFGAWGIASEIVQFSAKAGEPVVVKAAVTDDAGRVIATGHAYEIVGAGNVNKTAALENAETSAIGRALAVLGLHGGELASLNEIEGAERKGAAPPPADPETLDADTSGPPEPDEVTSLGAALDGAQGEEALIHTLERIFRKWGDPPWPKPLGAKSSAAMARLGLDGTATGVKVRARIAEQDSHTQKKGRAA